MTVAVSLADESWLLDDAADATFWCVGSSSNALMAVVVEQKMRQAGRGDAA